MKALYILKDVVIHNMGKSVTFIHLKTILPLELERL